MRYKNVHNLVIEGPDGVGKTTLIMGLFHHYNYRYMCYHRGELSNYIFAHKYNRPFTATQRGLPFLNIVLLCNEKELAKRIMDRGAETDDEVQYELSKVTDNRLFEKYVEEFKNDYDIFVIDTTNLSAQDVLNKVCDELDRRFEEDAKDSEISEWNQRYLIACKKYGLRFDVIDNQPYIEGKPIMVESTLHNGLYETFTDKRFPDNLLYSLAYEHKYRNVPKKYTFNYVINSKIKRRPEIYDYYKAFIKNNLTCLISDNPLIPKNKNLVRMGRVFGEQFIDALAETEATVYCARDLEYLKLQTARLYESILANNIIFVDKSSDTQCDILKAIHGENYNLINLLYVTPNNICYKYSQLTKSMKLKILENQRKYYDRLIKEFEENKEAWKLSKEN